MKRNTVLKLSGVERHYGQGETLLSILKGADFTLNSGEIVALVAPSGTGKSTLLHIAGLLEHPDGGEVIINGNACDNLPDDKRTAIEFAVDGVVHGPERSDRCLIDAQRREQHLAHRRPHGRLRLESGEMQRR